MGPGGSRKIWPPATGRTGHSAYIAGLGTWGLCDGMIYRLGKAVRFTTLILETKLPADPRPLQRLSLLVPLYRTGKCDSCIKACPAGRSANGHNKDSAEYIQDFAATLAATPFNADGLWLRPLPGNVPCQKGVPKGLDDYDGQIPAGTRLIKAKAAADNSSQKTVLLRKHLVTRLSINSSMKGQKGHSWPT